MTETGLKRSEDVSLPATAEGLNLGDLPLGSIQSRAAARVLLERKRAVERRREIIVCVEGKSRPEATEWEKKRDGTLERVIFLEPGSVLVDGLRSVGGFSDEELAQIAARGPELVPTFEIFTMEH